MKPWRIAEHWEMEKEDAKRDYKGIGYRKNKVFDTIVVVRENGAEYARWTCRGDEDGAEEAPKYAGALGVPYLGRLG